MLLPLKPTQSQMPNQIYNPDRFTAIKGCVMYHEMSVSLEEVAEWQTCKEFEVERKGEERFQLPQFTADCPQYLATPNCLTFNVKLFLQIALARRQAMVGRQARWAERFIRTAFRAAGAPPHHAREGGGRVLTPASPTKTVS